MSYGFVAYIDESGDDGLKRVKPRDPNGSTEWFVLAAMVIKAANERHVHKWRSDLAREINLTQRSDIHFSELKTDTRKRVVCSRLATLEQRTFVALSNKKNMRRHHNPFPVYEKNWFYWWMTRLLLERITEFCVAKSPRLGYQAPLPIKLVFSRRKGMSYWRCQQYLRWLKWTEETGRMKIKTRKLDWSVIDFDQLEAIDHKNSAGVQLADCVAGAFFQAVEHNADGKCNADYAYLLKDRVYARRNWYIGHGIKPMPQLHEMGLSPEQRRIFELYGYPKWRW